jgi:hypothetical protein
VPQQPATSFADDLQKTRDDFAADLAAARQHVDDKKDVPHPIVQKLLSWLPAVGGTLGAIAGSETGPGAIVTAGLGAAAGKAVQDMGNRAAGNPAPSDPRQIVDEAMTQGAIGAAGEAGGQVLGYAAKTLAPNFASGLMQSAVKPGVKSTAKALIRGSDSPIVQTLLKEGINVSPGGIERLTDVISTSNQAIKDALDAMPSSASVDPQAVAARLDKMIEQYREGGTPEANVRAVEEVKAEFLRNHGTPNSLAEAQTGLTLPKAQGIKQQTYQDLKDTAYGTVGTANIEARKELARGLKEGIESEAQRTGSADIQALNAREGAAITARDAIAKRIASAGNRDPVSLAWLAHNPTAGMMYLAERSPAVKSMLARGLWKSAALAAKVDPIVVKTIMQGLVNGGDMLAEPDPRLGPITIGGIR